jgi:hypothetical protein
MICKTFMPSCFLSFVSFLPPDCIGTIEFVAGHLFF